ncbi:terminase large subunit [Chitinimonas lacunae]|uniref:Terminase large subunit n=1 Tax=Chitinimonas lacunae TaxID=1963018 RepID=A0ABV8MXA3_9NEIS
MASYPHVNAAHRYARDVVAGRISACEWTRLACQRHFDDLEKSKLKGYPYRFDKDEAERPCNFVELLPHAKGKWARKGELIRLEPWQCFIFCVLFGWLRKKNGLRRFREAYIEVPRKNGKSVLAAGVGLYCFVSDGEYGAEVYCGATTERQAWEVFRPARQMAIKSSALREEAGIEVFAKTMSTVEDGSRFEPVVGDPGDGASPSCSIVDEFHEHADSSLYDTMETGMGAREQPLMFIITTAGTNMAGPCRAKRIEVEKMLQGLDGFVDDELFAIVYTIDKDDDWTDPKALAKANPNLGVSVDLDQMLAKQRKAARNPRRAATFKTKHLNLWVNAKNAWINLQEWEAAKDEALKIEDFAGERCVIGYDLASKLDFASVARLFWRDIDGRRHYYLFVQHHLPEDTINSEDNPNSEAYRGWEKAGWIEEHDGPENDFEQIAQELEALPQRYTVEAFAQDKFGAAWIAQRLTSQKATVISVPMQATHLSPAMREIEAALRAGRFHHNGDPVLTWMASNVVAKEDKNENLFPDKENNAQKIDGIVAAIIAMTRAMADPIETKSKFKSAYAEKVHL